MSNIIRALTKFDAERHARATQRDISRLIRAGRQPPPPSSAGYTPPSRPSVGDGIVPVWVINMPRRIS